MKQLVDAVATSIVAEVAGAGTWTVEKFDPLWRNPKKGKVLNIYSGRTSPGGARWTGSQEDLVEVIVEYAESSGNQPATLKRDQAAELAAEDVADSLRDWALAHEEGFSPAYRMDWIGTEYVPQVRRELFVRYCRVTFQFTAVKNFV